MKTPKKPIKKTIKYFNYNECSDYIEKKYGYEERDYAGVSAYINSSLKKTNEKFGNNGWYEVSKQDASPEQLEAIKYHDELLQKEPEYQDFWHFLLDHHEINNGGFFTMNKDHLMKEASDWQKEILQHYFDEFDPDNKGEIEFYVSW